MDNLNDSADIFANSSAETVTENVPSTSQLEVSRDHSFGYLNNKLEFSGPVCTSSPAFISPQPKFNGDDTSFIVNQFVSQACNVPVRIYCPFCPQDYGFEFLLKDHIKSVHPLELRTVIRSTDDDVKFYPCPFCHAKFYMKELLPKHILKKHESRVASMFSGKADDFIECRFCSHKVQKKHHKLFLVHLEKKHHNQFENYVIGKFSKIGVSCEDLISFDCEAKLTHQILTPSLSKKLMQLSTDGDICYMKRPMLVKPILKSASSYSPLENEPDFDFDQPVDFHPSVQETGARRKLRFNLPDSPDSENIDPRLAFAFGKKRNSKWKFFLRKKNKRDASPLKSSPKKLLVPKQKKMQSPLKGVSNDSSRFPLQFKCGICGEGFEKNALLLDHLKQKHKGLSLKAQYRCGECQAKFYRNSFLVRHCWHHHAPKCLKSPQLQKEA